MRLKAILIVFFGVPVCAAVVSSFPLVWLFAVQNDAPLSRGDLVAGAVFCVGAFAVGAVAFRAFLRVRRGDQGDAGLAWLAWAMPALIVVGLVAGVVFSVQIRGNMERSSRDTLVELCALPDVWGLDASNCPAKAAECRHQGAKAPLGRNDQAYMPLLQKLQTTQKRIDDEQWKIEKNGGFRDSTKTQPYERLIDKLTWSGESGDIDRATLVCLSGAKG
jgi:hypothetical protein